MSVTHSKRSTSRTIFSWVAISLASIAATWFGVISWWEITERVATTSDILLYLVALPIGVLAFIGWFGWRHSSQRERARPLSVQADAAVTGSSLSPAVDANVVAPDLPILATWVATVLGSDGNEFVDNLAKRRLRPVPDELLTDEQGFPPLTGRVKDIDTDVVIQTLMALWQGRITDNVIDAGEKRDALIRALALLESVLMQAAQEWPLDGSTSTCAQLASNDSATLRGSAGLCENEDAPLELSVKLLLSDAMTPSERNIAQAFAEQRLLMLGIRAPGQPVDVVATRDDATALKVLDAFRANMPSKSAQRTPQALLLLACDSALCPETIETWEGLGRLFGPHHPNGLMPGEAAYAILCANDTAVQIVAASPLCRLTSVRIAERSSDIDRKNAHACLTSVIGDALSAGGTAGDAIGTVVCDADHRAGVTLESIEAMVSHMPQLDAIENRLAVNESCGHLGAASVPAALCAAAIRSFTADHPVLMFSVGHALERAAAVLLPADTDGKRAQAHSLQDA